MFDSNIHIVDNSLEYLNKISKKLRTMEYLKLYACLIMKKILKKKNLYENCKNFKSCACCYYKIRKI